jgi:hypothetical protein
MRRHDVQASSDLLRGDTLSAAYRATEPLDHRGAGHRGAGTMATRVTKRQRGAAAWALLRMKPEDASATNPKAKAPLIAWFPRETEPALIQKLGT